MKKRGSFAEEVDLYEPVVCEGNIETWLCLLELRM